MVRCTGLGSQSGWNRADRCRWFTETRGPDLGPTRARAAWLELGVDGRGVANQAPDEDTPHDHIPRLTLEMVAAIQGFPADWKFAGKKTASYRQIGNAFPPPVAAAVGRSIAGALAGKVAKREQSQASRHLKLVESA